jgi:hypothetical protein
MEPGGFPGLQNQCDLTTSGWVGSIPMHSRQQAGYPVSVMMTRVHRRAFAWLMVAACALAIVPAHLRAQAPDTTAVDTAGPRPELKPPISPRRAFLYSLMLPGYAQSILGRGKTGTLLVAFESVAIVMLRESALNARDARRFLNDSVVVSYVDINGSPSVRYEPTRFTQQLLDKRREQVEDWIAVLIGNHLFAAADAYVAALLWDLPTEVAIRGTPRRASFAMRISW